jgi:GR25 family glycosyltransferase involved in LPS biosynthesis
LKKQIPIFVLTYKGSIREPLIKKKLNGLNLKYNLIYGLNAKIKKNQNILNSYFDLIKSKKIFKKNMNIYDIACSFGHMKIYKHIKKEKIQYAIIMEDDCSPGPSFVQWAHLKKKYLKNFDYIQFYSNSGLIYKKSFTNIDNNFFIHKAFSHLPLTTCYQINLKACKYLLNYYKDSIFQTSDFAGSYMLKNIKQYFVLPQIVSIDEHHLLTSTNRKIWDSVDFFDRMKSIIPFYFFLNSLFTILHIPYLLYFYKKYPYTYYKKYFLLLKWNIFRNYFLRKYININSQINNKSKY